MLRAMLQYMYSGPKQCRPAVVAWKKYLAPWRCFGGTKTLAVRYERRPTYLLVFVFGEMERVQVMGECRQPTYQLVLTKLTCDCNDCRLSTSAKRRGRTLLSGVVSIVPKVCVASRRRHSNRCRESVGWHGVYTEQHGEQVTAPSTGQ